MTRENRSTDDELTLHLTLSIASPDDVPGVLECLTASGASVVSMRTHDVDDDRVVKVELRSLTDRQLRTLERAYEKGYYETPRGADLGDLAAELDVSRSAVSQRLNAAETKLVSAILEGRTDRAD